MAENLKPAGTWDQGHESEDRAIKQLELEAASGISSVT
jgi:hypothetical protein